MSLTDPLHAVHEPMPFNKFPPRAAHGMHVVSYRYQNHFVSRHED